MKLMMLDGNSIINRAFYGIRMLNAPDGTPTNAVFGFLQILQRLLNSEKPDALCVAFDVHAPTFRHKLSDAYKAQRKPMPEELRVQVPLLKEVLDAMGIRHCEAAGWEADDLLGTMARRCEETGWDCQLVTGDKDAFQLITDRVHVYHIKTRLGQTESTEYDPARFREEYGFEPRRMIDLKALMGDSSDNIPGVPGIGEKTAMELLHRFETLDGVYENLADASIKDGQRHKLTEGEPSARLSYTLATIVPEAPLDFDPEDTRWSLQSNGTLYALLRRLNFEKFIEQWHIVPDETVTAAEPALPPLPVCELTMDEALAALETGSPVAVWPEEGLDALTLCDGQRVFTLRWTDDALGYARLLRRVFSAEVKKIGHNTKDLMGRLAEEGLSAEGFVFDTALAAYLLDATAADYVPEKLTLKYIGAERAGAEALMRLYPVLDKALNDNGMRALYYDMELPLCAVLCDMERAGITVDRKALQEMGLQLGEEITRLQQTVWTLAGHEFNLNSPKQLGTVLFDELGLPAGKKTKTGWSTNADVLEKLRYEPIVRALLDYRELAKLKSTYTDGLQKEIKADGRIHTSFQMTVTATGRLSSTEPNLQNIPVRKPSGAALRQMFVAAPGRVLVDADYSQIELRLLAHLSEDETMLRTFREGGDIHSATAARVYHVPEEAVTSAMRSYAKAVNFGIVYGISAFSLAQDIHVSVAEAKSFIETYLDTYPGVRDYMDRVIAEAKTDGFVRTLYGRRRSLPELQSGNFNLRAFGERVARNMPIQGTAADIMKLAMLRVHRRLAAEQPEARLLLQVHDELLVECPADRADAVAALLKEEMEAAASLSLPMRADTGHGRSWADAH